MIQKIFLPLKFYYIILFVFVCIHTCVCRGIWIEDRGQFTEVAFLLILYYESPRESNSVPQTCLQTPY